MEFNGTPWTSMDFHGVPWGYFTQVIFISLMQKSSFSVDNNVIIGTRDWKLCTKEQLMNVL